MVNLWYFWVICAILLAEIVGQRVRSKPKKLPKDFDDIAKFRRANFPCGKSFFPCSKKALFGVKNSETSGLHFDVFLHDFSDALDTDGSAVSNFISAQRDQVVQTISRTIDDATLEEASKKAQHAIDDLFNRTESHLYRDFRSKMTRSGPTFLDTFSPFSTQVWGDLTKVDRYAKGMSYSALVSIETTKNLQE